MATSAKVAAMSLRMCVCGGGLCDMKSRIADCAQCCIFVKEVEGDWLFVGCLWLPGQTALQRILLSAGNGVIEGSDRRGRGEDDSMQRQRQRQRQRTNCFSGRRPEG